MPAPRQKIDGLSLVIGFSGLLLIGTAALYRVCSTGLR